MMHSDPRYTIPQIICFAFPCATQRILWVIMSVCNLCIALCRGWLRAHIVKAVFSFVWSRGTDFATQHTRRDPQLRCFGTLWYHMMHVVVPAVTDVSTRASCRRLISRPWVSLHMARYDDCTWLTYARWR
jgi:hypothetical protein